MASRKGGLKEKALEYAVELATLLVMEGIRMGAKAFHKRFLQAQAPAKSEFPKKIQQKKNKQSV